MNKTLLITAYNREKIFFNTLRKLKSCKNYHLFQKVIVYQNISDELKKKILNIDRNIKIINTNFKKNYSGI